MKEAKIILWTLQGVLREAPPEVQAKVDAAAEKIRVIVAEHGEEGVVALTLVAAEEGVKHE